LPLTGALCQGAESGSLGKISVVHEVEKNNIVNGNQKKIGDYHEYTVDDGDAEQEITV
jgi:hypothetical protein